MAMEQWNKIILLFNEKKITPEFINHLYDNKGFPLIIRTQYALWIDKYINPSNRNDAKRVAPQESPQLIFQTLLEHIERDLPHNIQLSGPYTQLKDKYTNNEDEFIKTVRDILAEERTCIESAEATEEELRRKGQDVGAMTPLMAACAKLIPDMDLAMKTTNQSNDLLNMISVLPQKIVLAFQELQKIQRESNKEKTNAAALTFSGLLSALTTEVERALQHFQQMTNYLKTRMDNIWQLIFEWKCEQKLEIASLAKVDPSASNQLNDICEIIGLLLSTTLDHANRLKEILKQVALINVSTFIQQVTLIEGNLTELAISHLQKIFVVDKQPNQILKISSGRSPKFGASVCILGGNSLGMKGDQQMSVAAFLVRDNNMLEVMTSSEAPRGATVTIKNSEQQFKFLQKVNRHWVQATFPNLELYSPPKKDERKENELVTDIKYAIIFTTAVFFRGKVYPLKVASVPMVLVSQTSQDCMARGTLIWDAAFSNRDRIALEEPAEVEWKYVAKVLSAMFFEHTGRGLNDSHLDFLSMVAFNEESSKSKSKGRTREATDSRKITRQQLLKDKMCQVSDFSFWKWFQCCLTLVKDYVKTEWLNGWIHGFIGKLECRRLLRESNELGTFIIRFSQSEIEDSQKTSVAVHLTVAVLETDPDNPTRNEVFFIKEHLSPKHIHEHKLGPLLYAFEVKCIGQPGVKKQLLKILHPHRPLTDLWAKPKPPPVPEERANADHYLTGTLKVEIELSTRKDQQQQQQQPGLIRSFSSSVGPFSPGVSVMSPSESFASAMSPEPPSPSSVVEDPMMLAATTIHLPNGMSLPLEVIAQMGLEVDFLELGPNIEDPQTWNLEDIVNTIGLIADNQHMQQPT